MIYTVKAETIDGKKVEGYYAEVKKNEKLVSVVFQDGEGYEVKKETVRTNTSISTTNDFVNIYEGDEIEIFEEHFEKPIIGVVVWNIWDAGFVLKGEDGDYYNLVAEERSRILKR